MLYDNGNGRTLRVLKRMESVLANNGYTHFQKRIHIIYKTILSIERYEGCTVSMFSIDGDTSSVISDQSLFMSEYNSIAEDNVQFYDTEKREANVRLEDLFSFIESELDIKSEDNTNKGDTMSSSSSDEEKDPEGNKPIKTLGKQQIHNIERKIRACIKEEAIFSQTNFDSFLNDPRLKTPMSKLTKMSPGKSPLPAIVNNFFEDKTILEEAKKRFSLRADNFAFHKLGNVDNTQLWKTNYDRVSIKSQEGKETNEKISQFSFNDNGSTNEEKPKNSIKRDSIFRGYDFNDFLKIKSDIVNEALNDSHSNESDNEEEDEDEEEEESDDENNKSS